MRRFERRWSMQLFFQRSTRLNEQAAVNGFVGHAHALVVGILESSAIRKSARATSPGSVYSQRCPATCGSRLADISSVARPKPKLVDLRHGRDRQDGHHGERPPGSRWRPHDPVRRAISRIDEPEAIPREMSSRSARVSASRERRRAIGGIPPRGSNTARIEVCGLS